jgi:phage FluMu protein Com
MALPRLNTEPKYTIVIPSTGKQTRFRPYLVKEEKVLMLAMESQDEKQILDAVADTIIACVEDDIDKKKLTTFDLEYLFTKIRSKSVGEVAHIGLKCSECSETNEVDINIDSVEMKVSKSNHMIEITDEYTLEMKWPTMSDIMGLPKEANPQTMLSMLRVAMVALHTQDERLDLTEHSDQEIEDFLESMNTDQFTKIKDFVDNLPKLKHEVDYKCMKCGHDNHMVLEGMQSFF